MELTPIQNVTLSAFPKVLYLGPIVFIVLWSTGRCDKSSWHRCDGVCRWFSALHHNKTDQSSCCLRSAWALHWWCSMLEHLRQHFLATCRATLLLCKLQSFVARITTPANNLSRNNFQCCKLQEHVARSRIPIYFWQQILMLLRGW